MPDHDVIVIGAGPVGLLTACLLVQKGLDVVVCEKHSGSDQRTRAIGIHPPGLEALDAAGIGDEVRAEALALQGGDVLSRGRLLASVDFAQERRIMILPQRRTGELLREQLVKLDPGALRLGCDAVSARDERDFARLTVDSEGIRGELTASLIVAADGVRSSLRTDSACPGARCQVPRPMRCSTPPTRSTPRAAIVPCCTASPAGWSSASRCPEG